MGCAVQTEVLPKRTADPHMTALKSHVCVMLDTSLAYLLESDPVDQPSASAAPPDERTYFDAYSEAVTSVVETVGPAVVRVVRDGPGGRAGRRGRDRERGGTGSGAVTPPARLGLTN